MTLEQVGPGKKKRPRLVLLGGQDNAPEQYLNWDGEEALLDYHMPEATLDDWPPTKDL